MEQTQVAELPPEYSMRGDNATYLDYCHHASHKPGYAVCANKVFAWLRDGDLNFNPTCARAMLHNDCQALVWFNEEKTAGKSLHYIQRETLAALPDRPVVEPDRKPTLPFPIHKGKKSEPKPAVAAPAATSGYADAINAAMAELPAAQPKAAPKPVPVAPAAQPKPTQPVQAKPGMSLLEIARLRMQKKA
jgi:hypothetical protein